MTPEEEAGELLPYPKTYRSGPVFDYIDGHRPAVAERLRQRDVDVYRLKKLRAADVTLISQIGEIMEDHGILSDDVSLPEALADRLSTDRNRIAALEATLDKLLDDGPGWHHAWCKKGTSNEADCDCGADEARAALAGAKNGLL